MRRIGFLIGAVALAAACQEEVIVHESSIASEFARMNKNGWQVTRNDQAVIRPLAAEPDPNVRVIRGADFSGYQFNTNFQLDDPRAPQTRPWAPLPGEPSAAPAATPISSAPRMPGP